MSSKPTFDVFARLGIEALDEQLNPLLNHAHHEQVNDIVHTTIALLSSFLCLH